MTAAITTLRSTIATAITNASVWSTFSYPPSTLVANSVIVVPSDPYIVPSNNERSDIAPLASFKIIMMIPMFDNAGNLQGIEETIVAVFNLLAASTIVYNITSVSAPSVISVASGDLLSSEFTISVLTSWT
jgi:hypothetical protein